MLKRGGVPDPTLIPKAPRVGAFLFISFAVAKLVPLF